MTTTSTDPAALPEPLRARVVQLSAQVLPDVGVLPPPLRKVATFAPQRRARLGGGQIAAALGDDDLRDRVATQVVARSDLGGLATELLGPATGDDEQEREVRDLPLHDPVDVAALLWLVRPPGWEAAYDAALARLDEVRDAAVAAEDAEARRALERRVAVLEDELARQRVEAREQHDALRAENTSLRRKVGEARAAGRGADEARERALEEQRQAQERATAAASAAEGEVRRLRRQVEELQAQVATRRGGARAEREDATMRTRLLLDTLVASAQGLQRELGLPAAPETATPGERHEASLVATGTRTTSAAGALGTGSPALLEQLIAMPRARLIVDGYNVTKQTWGGSSLEVQRLRLVNGIAPVVARSGAETTVVFDAASSPTRPVITAPRGVRVAFSPEHVIADDVIRDLVNLEPTGRMVVVVTSDQALARDVRRAGATVMDAVALAGLLTR
ncbi:NYN domain-containing protein [Nocardioides zeae]|uniref:RNA-binding protein with PIN domain n=1 Tax=Nocardioides zeae TaxID=1457234 RepID=A0AAJ1X0J6_9ACTN|nr:NYN domain-containing protein [Nocardioides zeae]MDQ1103204.1 putative RNA-binding protein with PIN domain [Nocardioides zeae]